MTVPSTTSRVTYAGDGSSTAFPVSFYFLANADLVVLLVDGDGNSTTQVLTTNYTVTGAGVEAGGTVTMLVAPPSGYTLVIFRDPAITQLVDYAPNDPFPAETHERALDRLTMIAQRSRELGERAIRLPDSADLDFSLALPTPNAGKALLWGPDGESIINSSSNFNTIVADAETAKTGAEAAQAAAEAAQASTEAVYDAFDDRYLGSKAADPTLDNDGNALVTGALYFNTVANEMRVYNGTVWLQAASAQPASFTPNTFSGTGAQTVFALSATAASSQAVLVFIDGVRQTPVADYTAAGMVLTFTVAPASGTDNISVLTVATAAAGVPDDDSVSAVKIQTNAVTTAKILDANVTTAKIAGSAVTAAKLNSDVFAFAATFNTGTNETQALNSKIIRENSIVSSSVSASGTSVDFTGIPAWVKRIVITTVALSGSGTSIPMVQLGDSGGIENSGYAGYVSRMGGSGASYLAFNTGAVLTDSSAAADVYYGHIIIEKSVDGTNTWTISSSVTSTRLANLSAVGVGAKSLSAALDRVRVTFVNGTDTFDAGTISLSY